MPRGNGTGPRGRGPMSGRGGGRRSGNNRAALNNNRNQQGSLLSSLRGWFSGSNNRMSGRGRSSGSGRGRGMGQGMGRGMESTTSPEWRESSAMRTLNKDRTQQDAAQLREKARQMEDELTALQKKISDLESKKPVSKVLVDEEVCIVCGRCEEICPRGAISVKAVAEVDPDLCTLCGACVNECPQEALRIV